MIVVRSLAVVGWLGSVMVGAGCGSPLPPEASGTGETGETGPGTGDSGADETGETGPENSDSGLDETGEPGPMCGNGIVEAGESCDDGAQTATCDADCTPAYCGDGWLNETAGEQCDGDELAGGTCEGLGFDAGTLACGAGCGYDTSECVLLPAMPVLQLGFSPVKRFDFSWAAVAEAEYYQVLESPAPGEPFGQLGEDIVGESVSFEMPLHHRFEASYMLRACNDRGCTDSAVVDVMGSLEQAVGYVKASNTGGDDLFGFSVALSADGNTLAVGAPFENSNATGIDGNQADDASSDSGAVYVFTRDPMGTWSQQAYLKASNTGSYDWFGARVSLSANGNTLAVSAPFEDSSATGIDGNQADDSSPDSGAVYVFVRDPMGTWAQHAYLKASNTDAGDDFGTSVALSADGNTLAVGAHQEDSSATGIDGNQADDASSDAGAVYVFVRDPMGPWAQHAYLKAANTDSSDYFGWPVALSADGSTLAVGAYQEDSSATGIDGNQADDSSPDAGAVYVFARDPMGTWSQHAYLKASNTDAGDTFGTSVALSADGSTLAVGARHEDSSATGIDGNQADDSSSDAGAVYVFAHDRMGTWSQHAYVKASNPGSDDRFGTSVALDADGNTLAIGARYEGSSATGIDGNQADDDASDSGAVYVFVRDPMGTWSQRAYVKASNTGSSDWFGDHVALSADGNTLAAGAPVEDGSATGIAGNQADDSLSNAGAVYLY